jgi:hypothetical protein
MMGRVLLLRHLGDPSQGGSGVEPESGPELYQFHHCHPMQTALNPRNKSLGVPKPIRDLRLRETGTGLTSR